MLGTSFLPLTLEGGTHTAQIKSHVLSWGCLHLLFSCQILTGVLQDVQRL